MIRIFVAFPVPVEWRKSFLALSKQNPPSAKIRWTPEEHLHITLFFIGEIKEENLESVSGVLKSALSEQPSFKLEFENFILKGKKSKPAMVWALYKRCAAFTEVSSRLHDAVKNFMTVKTTHEDPLPHCTLARIKHGAQTEKLVLHADVPGKELNVDAAELWKTVQTKDGVVYERLEKWQF